MLDAKINYPRSLHDHWLSDNKTASYVIADGKLKRIDMGSFSKIGSSKLLQQLEAGWQAMKQKLTTHAAAYKKFLGADVVEQELRFWQQFQERVSFKKNAGLGD